jgi:hypothetical protein
MLISATSSCAKSAEKNVKSAPTESKTYFDKEGLEATKETMSTVEVSRSPKALPSFEEWLITVLRNLIGAPPFFVLLGRLTAEEANRFVPR